jgi:DNA-directed RNA polymerase specialized sigma24 family protein
VKAKEIINLIASTDEYKSLCRVICKGSSIYKDLYQELFIILLMQPEAKIEEMYLKGQLKWFVVRILKNQFESKTSPFYKKYGKYRDSVSELIFEVRDETEEQDDSVKDEIIKELNTCKDQNDYYEKTLFKEYVVCGENFNELSRLTKIDYRSVRYTVNNLKLKIKTKWNKPY